MSDPNIIANRWLVKYENHKYQIKTALNINSLDTRHIADIYSDHVHRTALTIVRPIRVSSAISVTRLETFR